MAATFKKKFGKNIKALTRHPNQASYIYTMTGDDSYPTGGYPVSGIDEPIIAMVQLNYNEYLWGYNRDTGKLSAHLAVDTDTDGMAPDPDGKLTEAAAMTDMEGEVINFLVIVDQI